MPGLNKPSQCGPYPEKTGAVNIVPTGLRRSGVMRPVTRAQLLNRIAQAFETYFVVSAGAVPLLYMSMSGADASSS